MARVSPRKVAVLLAAAGFRLAAAATGDMKCLGSMCIHATLNGTEVQYVMEAKTANVGWMGVGFGTMMGNSKMVIMWQNSDGSVTLSQRTAPYEVMPTVDSSPPRVAALSMEASSLTGQPKFAFTIPHDGNMEQNLIWAMCATNPGSPAIDAPLKYHQGHGGLILDLSKSLDGSASLPTTAATPLPPVADKPVHHTKPVPVSTKASSAVKKPATVPDTPLLPYQRMIVAHAVFCAAGFMLFLPAGALLARYLRTFTPTWFTGHWIVQFLLSAPVILMGVAMGAKAVNKAGMTHLDDAHKKSGAALVMLYCAQCALGAFIHFVKPKARPSAPRRRPARNYVHGVLGVLLVALGGAQVRSGYHTEWAATTARSVPAWVNVAWWAWALALPVVYGVGLALLPRQFRQERAGPGAEGRGLLEEGEEKDDDEMAMKERIS